MYTHRGTTPDIDEEATQMKKYEFTFENGCTYNGTISDKNEFVKHLTKREKSEMGKIVSKRILSDNEWNAWENKVNAFLATV